MKHIDKIAREVAQGCAILLGAALAAAAFVQGNLHEGLAWICVAILMLTVFGMDRQCDRQQRLINELLEITRHQDDAWAECVTSLTDKLCQAMEKIGGDIKQQVAQVEEHLKGKGNGTDNTGE